MSTNAPKNPIQDPESPREDRQTKDRKARAKSANPDVPSPQEGSTPVDDHPDP